MSVVKDPDNEQVLGQMIDQYGKDLFRLCCVYLRDASLAEDAVQETFIKAYNALESFRGKSSMRTWLMRIAMNVCHNMHRNAWFRYVDRRAAFDTLPLTVEDTPDMSIALMSEVMNLPQKEREVVWLYYYEDMRIREISGVLGVTTPAVSLRLSRARDRLRKALGEGGKERHG